VNVDVAIVGAGLAGAWMARELARQGRRVALIEREEGPRTKSGGWLPVSAVSALAEGGLREALSARYLASPSLRVLCARTGRARVFAYDERTDSADPAVAFHAPRADLDLLLTHEAKAHGAAVFMGVRAMDPAPTEDGYRVRARGPEGDPQEIAARFVVDASGEARWMSARASTPSERDGLDGTAMETHLVEAQPSAGAPLGAGDLVSFAHGALWMLPLRGGIHTVGASVSAAWAGQRRGAEGPEDFFERTVRDAAVLRGALSRARRLHGVGTRVPVSTRVERRAGPRWLAVGAAGGTVEPALGMDSALAVFSVTRAMAVVSAALDGDGDDEAAARAVFEGEMDEAEAHCEDVARAIYRGALADGVLAADLSRSERAGARAILRCALAGDELEAARNFVRAKMM
jgi:flavin-dependent dehydrogenase